MPVTYRFLSMQARIRASRLAVARGCLRTALSAAVAAALLAAVPASAPAGDLPPGFHERTVLDGLDFPTAIRFAPDGRVFVAEKDGVLKVFDGLEDATPEVFADLRRDVNSFGDRGLLGLALDPDFASNGYVYVLYTYDAPIGGTAPTYGPFAEFDYADFCSDQCEVGGRLVRLDRADGTLRGKVLIKDNWCQQWSSHSIGALEFDDQGRLYVSGGDGANFNVVDYGQQIGPPNPDTPPNPCGDPPGPENQELSPPTSEGGALRSQDLHTIGDPVDLSGTIARVDPDTGDGVAANPLSSSSDPNARRILAYGLRNPFRFVLSPSGKVWVGETGWRDWEELNSFSASAPAPLNFGWPCYEGFDRQPGYEALGLTLCGDLYASPATVSQPSFVYNHHAPLYPGDPCPVPGDGSATAGIELYDGSSFPPPYQDALFFSDYARHCIWAIAAGVDGEPNPATVHAFDVGVVSPVDLEVGPDGALYYVDIGLGEVRRIQFAAVNGPPEAVAAASPTSGPTPLSVQFDGTGSSDPDLGDTLTYEWDLDGDGAYDDSTEPSPTFEYETATTVVAGLEVTDVAGNVDTDTVRIDAGNRPPVAEISGPAPGTDWAVGDPLRLIGRAEDPDEGDLDPSALRWTVDLNHCVPGGGCHVHRLQTINGSADFELPAPDHYYPAHLTIGLTASDSEGLQSTPQRLSLDPRTVELGFASTPSGLVLNVNGFPNTAPFSLTAIEGSATTVAALSPQALDGRRYEWTSWSDGGERVHGFQASSPGSLTAVFAQSQPGGGTGGGSPPPPSSAYTPSLEVLKLHQAKRARGLVRNGVQALARCSSECTLTVRLRGEGKGARKAGLEGKVGKAEERLAAGISRWVRVYPGRRARRRLLEHPLMRVPWIVPRFAAAPAG